MPYLKYCAYIAFGSHEHERAVTRAPRQFTGSLKIATCPCHLAWNKFIALEDFARFTSEQVVGKEQHAKKIAVASGFNKPFYSRTDRVMVQDRDTDTLVFLLAHYNLIHCKKFWPKTDTVKKEEINPN